jgi:hypothetical protein
MLCSDHAGQAFQYWYFRQLSSCFIQQQRFASLIASIQDLGCLLPTNRSFALISKLIAATYHHEAEAIPRTCRP